MPRRRWVVPVEAMWVRVVWRGGRRRETAWIPERSEWFRIDSGIIV
jgi:hypothetical protein